MGKRGREGGEKRPLSAPRFFSDLQDKIAFPVTVKNIRTKDQKKNVVKSG